MPGDVHLRESASKARAGALEGERDGLSERVVAAVDDEFASGGHGGDRHDDGRFVLREDGLAARPGDDDDGVAAVVVGAVQDVAQHEGCGGGGIGHGWVGV